MSEISVICPKCAESFALSDSIAATLLADREAALKQESDKRNAVVQRKEDDLAARETALNSERQELDSTLSYRLSIATAEIVEQQREVARKQVSDDIQRKDEELKEANEALAKKQTELAASQKTEAEFRRKSRQLEEQQARLDLTVEEKVASQSEEIKQKATKMLNQALV